MATLGELRVQITGDTSGIDRALDETKSTINRLESSLQSIGSTLTTHVTAPLSAMAGVAVKSFMDFDTAIAGVRKTVDATDDQFAALVSQIQEMSNRLPASVEEISAVAEAAGQLGVATGDIAAFTETMINLGETTNLTSEQAAVSLARFSNVMGTAPEDVERLGSAIVALGNSFATTEAEILEMSSRLAGASNTIGLTESQVFGLATALTSVGINAEAGGTAFSRVMIEMNNAAEEGGEALARFAEVAGVSVREFSEVFERDAGEAIVMFVEGLNRMEQEGENVAPILDELGFGGIRVSDALRRSASAGDLMSEAMEAGSRAFEENTALAEEAEQRYATLASQFQVLRNRVNTVAIQIGSYLAPQLLRLSEAAVEAVESFSSLTDRQRSLTIAAAGVAAALGPAFLAMSKLVGVLNVGVTVAGAVVSAFSGLASALLSAGSVVTGLTGTIGGLVGGAGILVAFAGAARAIQDNWSTLVSFFIGFGDTLRSVVSSTVNTALGLWREYGEVAYGVFASLTDNIASILTDLVAIMATGIEQVVSVATGLWSIFGDTILDIVQNAFNAVIGVVTAFGDFFAGFVGVIRGVVQGDFGQVWEGLREMIVAVWDAIVAVVKAGVGSLLTALSAGLNWMPIIGPAIEEAQEAFEDWITEDLKNRTRQDARELGENAASGAEAAVQLTAPALSSLQDRWRSTTDAITSMVSPSSPTSMTTEVKEGATVMSQALEGVIPKMRALGPEAIDTATDIGELSDEIIPLDENLRKSAEAMGEAEKEAEQFQARIRNLSNIINLEFKSALKTLVSGALGGSGGLRQAISQLQWSLTDLAAGGITDTITKLVSGEQSLKGAFNNVVGTVKGLAKSIGSGGEFTTALAGASSSVTAFSVKLAGGSDQLAALGGMATTAATAIAGPIGGIAVAAGTAAFAIGTKLGGAINKLFGRDTKDKIIGVAGSFANLSDRIKGVGDDAAIDIGRVIISMTRMGATTDEVRAKIEQMLERSLDDKYWDKFAENIDDMRQELLRLNGALAEGQQEFMLMEQVATLAMRGLGDGVTQIWGDTATNLRADMDEMTTAFEEAVTEWERQLSLGNISAERFRQEVAFLMQNLQRDIRESFERAGGDIGDVMERVRDLVFGSTDRMEMYFDGMSTEARASFTILREHVLQQFDRIQQAGKDTATALNSSFSQIMNDIDALFANSGQEMSAWGQELRRRFEETADAADQEFAQMQRLFEIAFRTGSDEAFEFANASRENLDRLLADADRRMDLLIRNVEEAFGAGSEEARLFRVFAGDEMQKLRDRYRDYLAQIDNDFSDMYENTEDNAAQASSGISDRIKGFFQGLPDKFRNVWGDIKDRFKDARNSSATTYNSVKKDAEGAASTARSTFNNALGNIEWRTGRMANNVRSQFRGVGSEAENMSNRVRNSVNNLHSRLSDVRLGITSTVNYRSFASGGIAFGETLANVGDYPGARSNPEVIAPLSDLEGMLKSRGVGGGDSGGVNQTIVVQLDGRELARSTAENLPEYLEVLNLR